MIAALVARVGAWQRDSIHRRILSAAALVAAFTLLGKVLGAAKEVLVAHRFGASDEVDAFLLALLLPSFAVSLFGSSMNSALIPTYVEVREREGREAGQRLLSSVLVLTTAFLATAAVVIAVVVPLALPLVSSDYTPAKLRLTTQLSYVVLPGLVVGGTSLTWSAVLNAHERFGITAAAALGGPVLMIVSLLVFGRTWGIHALAWGWVVGLCVEAVLVAVALRREGISVLPRWHGMSRALRQVIGQYAPGVAGTVVMGTNPIVDSLMAAALGTGSIAVLGYGSKVESFAMAVGAASLSAVVLPHFSRLVAVEDWSGLERFIRRYSEALLLLAVPAAIALIALSEPIVRVLFERGAFTRSDTILVARIQAFYLAAIPFRIVGQLYLRFIQASKANKVLMWVSVLNALTNVLLNYVLSRYLGVAGIALSTSFVYVIAVSVMFVYTRRSLRALGAGRPLAARA